MWIFLTSGLIMPAAVPPQADPALTRNGKFDIQVRGRERAHLEAFAKRIPKSQRSGIQMTPSMDYQCRFYTSKEALLAGLWPEVSDIDYLKFKPQAGAVGGTLYEQVLNRLWSVVYGEYGGWGRKPEPPPADASLELLDEVAKQWEAADGAHYLVPAELVQRIERYVRDRRDAIEDAF